MQRKIIIILAFVALIIIAVVFVLNDRGSTIRRGHMDFTLEEPSQVDKIIIGNHRKSILIEKNGEDWRLNGQYQARKEIVTMFLQAMGRLEVLSPASRSISDTIIRRLEEKGIHLTLYRGNKTLKSLFVYYEKEFVPGTYMMDERQKKPYRIGLTGYKRDNIESLFSTAEISWKDNVLFFCEPGEIAAVEIRYPQQPERSFCIARDKNNTPSLYTADKALSPEHVNKDEILDYLSYFVPVHYTIPADTVSTIIWEQDPFAVLTITGQHNDIFSIKAFRIRLQDGRSYDMHRYIAINDSDSLPVIVKYADTDPIMKSYVDFLKK
ncbi:MAG: hypothetical protein JXR41_03755 [Bacteroidales bacterium]|nr:hypothetical protein [Bacteroidales bacterium]MBN2762182.1 hypothetical protein [Bacteroidales bacterium]